MTKKTPLKNKTGKRGGQNGKDKEKRKVGRPSKYDGINLEQIETLAGFGLTEEQISEFIGVTDDTLRKYKNEHPEFLGVIKKGKTRADLQVIKSLYQRATGYNHPELYVSTYKGEIITKEINKHYPPDVGAAIWWLKNRQRDKWRDRWDLTIGGDKDNPITFVLKGMKPKKNKNDK